MPSSEKSGAAPAKAEVSPSPRPSDEADSAQKTELRSCDEHTASFTESGSTVNCVEATSTAEIDHYAGIGALIILAIALLAVLWNSRTWRLQIMGPVTVILAMFFSAVLLIALALLGKLDEATLQVVLGAAIGVAATLAGGYATKVAASR